eukprot:TRINITY_DN1613_c0_g2_i2.p1 TRINITY_DN1613_c0_g2~~TRINITY_DN1613_c0_g2_i2.p1  ORF type:complete len:154 (-),score=52.04 TRINITY_DN1613_c0_g2_i2:222-683(-)
MNLQNKSKIEENIKSQESSEESDYESEETTLTTNEYQEYSNLLQTLIENQSAKPFLQPPDLDKRPEIIKDITGAIDLKTVQFNLKNNQYSSPNAIMRDIYGVFRFAYVYYLQDSLEWCLLDELTKVTEQLHNKIIDKSKSQQILNNNNNNNNN